MLTPTDLLQHYIIMLMREAGLGVDSDTYAEISDIIDGIVVPLDQRIKDLERRVAVLEEGEY